MLRMLFKVYKINRSKKGWFEAVLILFSQKMQKQTIRICSSISIHCYSTCQATKIGPKVVNSLMIWSNFINEHCTGLIHVETVTVENHP